MSSVVHVIGYVGRQSYGLGAVALNLAAAQLSQGCDSRIWCLETPGEIAWAAETSGIAPERIRGFRAAPIGFPGFTPAMEREVRRVPASGKPDAVHQHSIWSGLSRVTREWGRQGVPTVVAAHGALHPWALKKSAWKKKLAAWAFESKNLREAACLHACGENEVGDYRGFSLRNPIALLPNAISEEWVGSVGDGTRFRARYNIPEQARMMLYLSRITPKKGLPMLLEAMATLRKQSEPWVLAIAGTEEFGHQAELKEQTRALDLGKQVIFAGPQHGQDKRDAYAAADLFVLPTHSEGSPIVVLEALGAGIPVLTTKGAPWADLERYRCGWWSEISTDGIYEALREASGLTTSALAEAGARGKALVRSKYNWNEIASKTIRLYDWLAGRCAQPEFVITD